MASKPRKPAPDPIARFNAWFRRARKSDEPLPEKCALATADGRGRPSVRYVLLKGADADGFVFYTNKESRKGREIAANPYASLAFYWDDAGHQVRIEGKLVEVSEEEADAYWDGRPRGSQIASLTSRQSRSVETRKALVDEMKRIERAHEGREVPRPERWSGFRLVPSRIEFWTRREPRLHHRESFKKTRGGWKVEILQP